MVDHFGKFVEPEDHMFRAVSAEIDVEDIIRSVLDMGRDFLKAEFNDEANFDLLLQSVNKIL